MSVEYIGSTTPEFEQNPPKPVETIGIEPQIKTILERIGEDPEREGLLNTPHRVDKAFAFLTSGYRANLEKEINGAIFDEADSEHFDEMVLVKEIEFYSLCEHHMIPFFGKMHIAYIPNRKIIGLSKLPRIVEIFARRLQVQERLTQQIARCVDEVLSPYGVAVVAEARHMCMCMRGIQKQSSWTTTSSMLGTFRENPQTRSEFLNLIK